MHILSAAVCVLLSMPIAAAEQNDLAAAQKNCDAGKGDACIEVATAYGSGIGVSRDVVKAFAAYRKACDAGNAMGCMRAGTDEGSLVSLRTQACELGNGIGCYELGVLYDQGVGVAKDAARAAALYKKACDAGNADACARSGGKPGKPPSTEKLAADIALKNLETLCRGGHGPSCKELGDRFATADPKRAAESYLDGCTRDYAPACEALCNSGSAQGCSYLGDLYAEGKMAGDGSSVPKDEPRAAALYKKACDGGYAEGCANLANYYRDGKGGLPKDEATARGFSDRACNGGYPLECLHLGILYAAGAGVRRDLPKSHAYYEKACNTDDRDVASIGCYALALQYDTGVGVARDRDRAAALFKTACDDGNAEACRKVK